MPKQLSSAHHQPVWYDNIFLVLPNSRTRKASLRCFLISVLLLLKSVCFLHLKANQFCRTAFQYLQFLIIPLGLFRINFDLLARRIYSILYPCTHLELIKAKLRHSLKREFDRIQIILKIFHYHIVNDKTTVNFYFSLFQTRILIVGKLEKCIFDEQSSHRKTGQSRRNDSIWNYSATTIDDSAIFGFILSGIDFRGTYRISFFCFLSFPSSDTSSSSRVDPLIAFSGRLIQRPEGV